MKIIDKIVIDNKAPKNKNVMWIDTSNTEPVQRYYWNGEWKPLRSSSSENTQTSANIDSVPTRGSNNLITSGAVYDVMKQIPVVFDLYIPNAGTYNKDTFEFRTGTTSDEFMYAVVNGCRWVRKLLNPQNDGTVSPADPSMSLPVIHVDDDYGQAPYVYPIITYANASVQTYSMTLLGVNESWSVVYEKGLETFTVTHNTNS